ncbi:MAG: helix-turn-helix domain-containing protein [Dehalococcoidia bacterium]
MRPRSPYSPPGNARDWLTLEQAACELGVSVSTVRRRIRNGELRNRIVPRRGGFAYRIYIPDSRHGREPLARVRPGGTVAGAPALAPRDLEAYRRERAARLARVQLPPARHERPPSIDRRLARISAALLNLVASQRMPLPAGIGERAVPNASAPYARYRALVRRRRWWQR